MTAKTEPVIIERVLNAPARRVWKAITNKDEMKHWYFNLKEFKAEVGFEFSFEGGPPEKTFVHLCKVTEVEFCKKLTYSWRFEGYEGNSFVTFELFAGGENQTRLKLTHTGLETFPNTSEFLRENFVMGWTNIIGKSLKEYLEK